MAAQPLTAQAIHRLNVSLLRIQHYFSRGLQTARQSSVQKLKGNCDTCKNVTLKVTIVLVSCTVYYAPFINLGAYPGHYKFDVCLLSDTAPCAYFSDKNNFPAVFLPVRQTKTEETELNFILDIGSEMQLQFLMNSFQLHLIHS